jgi:hypothetical protein
MTKMSNTVQKIDEKQALIWLDKRYKHQRPINQRHVDHLARAMHEGKFSPVNSIAFSLLDGQVSLINGQHTLRAIVQSKRPQTLNIVYYTVDNETEEAELYFRMDKPLKRNTADSMRATNIPETLSLSPSKIRETASALRFMKENFGVARHTQDLVSDDDLIEWLPLWSWEAHAVWNCLTGCTARERNLITRKAVLSVALATMRYQPSDAREFWGQVAHADALDRNDPRLTLREWLLSEQGRNNRLGGRTQNYAIARGCILAWNMFREHKPLRVIVVHNPTAVVCIDGTVFSGAQAEDFMPLYKSPNDDTETEQ